MKFALVLAIAAAIFFAAGGPDLLSSEDEPAIANLPGSGTSPSDFRVAPVATRGTRTSFPTPNVQATQIAQLQTCQEAQAKALKEQADYNRAVQQFGADSVSARLARSYLDTALSAASRACR